MHKSGQPVGIDIGTSTCRVGVWQNGDVDVIATVPNCVAFTEHGTVFGDAAKKQISKNTANSVFGIKHIIGRHYDEPAVQRASQHWPFELMNSKNRPQVKLTYQKQTKTFWPVEITTLMMRHVKETAEANLKKKVHDVVVTVPSSFGNAQRQATIDACTIAGMNVLKIINEPSAAALSFVADNRRLDRKRNVLVLTFGGGFLDVSLMQIRNGEIEVRATAGDPHLGGEEFSHHLLKFCMEEFNRRSNKDMSKDKNAMQRLRDECKRVKIALSSVSEATISLDNLHEGCDYNTIIPRKHFEVICKDLFDKIRGPIKQCLKDAKMEDEKMNDLILVGGSSHIPRVQSIVQDMFGGKYLNTSVDTEDAAVGGAAIQAMLSRGQNLDGLKGIKLTDVIPMSIGVEIAGDVMYTLIAKNSTMPVQKTDTFIIGFEGSGGSGTKKNRIVPTKMSAYRFGMVIQIYEGEETNSKKNNIVGQFEMADFPASMGTPEIDITFAIDTNGILQVSAEETITKKKVLVKQDKDYLSNEDIERIKKDIVRYTLDSEAQNGALNGDLQ